MDRRDFIRLTAVTGTSAALNACGNPEHQLIRFVPEDDIVPGIAEWKPSVSVVVIDRKPSTSNAATASGVAVPWPDRSFCASDSDSSSAGTSSQAAA